MQPCGLFTPRLSDPTTHARPYAFKGSLSKSMFIVLGNKHHSMICPLDELLANIHLSISHNSLRIFFHVSDKR